MSKKKTIPPKFRIWIEARTRHRLSHAQIQMARELGMNPKKFGKLDNHRQERWKLPLGLFIEKCYLKRYGKLPTEVLSIEQRIAKERKKKTKRREDKQRRSAEAANSGEAASSDEAESSNAMENGPGVAEHNPDTEPPF
jgi:hypothetical protein